MRKTHALLCACCAAAGLFAAPAMAVEGGTGFYLLGSRTSMGGFVPPPGTYFSSSTYAFVGNADLELPPVA